MSFGSRPVSRQSQPDFVLPPLGGSSVRSGSACGQHDVLYSATLPPPGSRSSVLPLGASPSLLRSGGGGSAVRVWKDNARPQSPAVALLLQPPRPPDPGPIVVPRLTGAPTTAWQLIGRREQQVEALRAFALNWHRPVDAAEGTCARIHVLSFPLVPSVRALLGKRMRYVHAVLIFCSPCFSFSIFQ